MTADGDRHKDSSSFPHPELWKGSRRGQTWWHGAGEGKEQTRREQREFYITGQRANGEKMGKLAQK